MRRRGITVIEMLVASVIATIIGAGLFQAIISTWNTHTVATGTPPVNQDAVDMVNRIAHDIRKAPRESSSEAVISASTANTINIYTSSAGAYVTYSAAADGSGALQRSYDGGSATDLHEAAVSLTLSYCINTSSNYGTMSSVDSMTWQSSVSDATEMKRLVAVKITATVTRGGLTGTYTTVVRPRNSPKKLSASS